VVPERDAGALGRALRRVLTSPELAERLGESGRQRVARTSYEAMLAGYEGAIAKATSRTLRGGSQRPFGRIRTYPPAAPTGRPLRVLVAHVKYLQPGGEDSVFRSEVRLLRASGVEVTSLELASEELDRIAPLQRLEMGLRYRDHRYGRRLIRRGIDHLEPDVVHFHNLMPLLGPGAMLEADAAGCATVQTLHNYRLSCLAGTHVLNGRPCTLCRPGHYLAGVRNRCYRESLALSLLAADATRAQWNNLVHRGVPTIAITLNQYMKDQFVDAGGAPDRLVVKPNSVDARAGEPLPRSGVLAAGRLSPEKGIVDLMSVWPADAPKLRVAGSGPLESEVRGLAHGNIEYVGQLPRAEVRRMMRGARVVVVPALSPAPDTLTALESLAEGTPLVAFDAGPMGEIAAEIQPGCSVRLGDFKALARAACDLDASPEWGDVARRCVRLHEGRYSNAVNISLLQKVYERAVELRRS
jgi:glycosyltransferase involved in cell wall biosynthesis